MKKFIKDYLSFTRKERIAVFTLLFLMAFIFFFPSVSAFIKPAPQLKNDTAWSNAMERLIEKPESTADFKDNISQSSSIESYQYDASVSNKEIFYFDPNTITKSQWIQLGLREKTAETILKYISKGGKFKQPEDLKKVYGLQQRDCERLLPYVRIAELQKEAKPIKEIVTDAPTTQKSKSFSSFEISDINAADTSDFITLYGIGSKLAARIVNFRDKLGGFYSVDQVKETYGVADSVFQKIKSNLHIGSTPIKKININTASLDELKSHPYLKYDISKTIIAYRKEHGEFAKKEDLRKVIAVTSEVYEKIVPYITIE